MPEVTDLELWCTNVELCRDHCRDVSWTTLKLRGAMVTSDLCRKAT